MTREDGRVEIPCRRDCPERAEGCHGRCERYREYSEWRERIRQAKREATEADGTLSAGAMDRKARYLRKTQNLR